MTKLQYVIKVLKESKRIAEKVREDYGATTKSFTEENVFDYGIDGMGAIANDIIAEGKRLKVI